MPNDNRTGIWLHRLPVFNGTFSWDKKTLQANIKAEKPDYDPNDPKTWPRMTVQKLRQFLGEAYDGTIEPPTGIAYERMIVLACLQKRPGIQNEVGKLKQLSSGNTVDVKLCFYRFPFTYGCGGKVMRCDCLTAGNRLNWIQTITGRNPGANQSTDGSQSEQPKSPAEAFNEVLQMINDAPPDTSAEIDALRQEINGLEEKLKVQGARVSSLEREHDKTVRHNQEQLEDIKCKEEKLAASRRSEAKLQIQHKALETDLSRSKFRERQLQQMLTDVSNDRRAAKERVGILEQTVRERDRQLSAKSQDLEVAKKAAIDADERVLKIWAEMKSKRRRGAREALATIPLDRRRRRQSLGLEQSRTGDCPSSMFRLKVSLSMSPHPWYLRA